MARLILKLGSELLEEIPLNAPILTIGRLPGNALQIENLAVSGHHAKLVLEDGHHVLYDQQSTNGVYVNGQKVERATLQDGDTILVGRHILEYESALAGASKSSVGILLVTSGKTSHKEYLLDEDESLIGKSDKAKVRLMRWFAPNIAATIHRRNGRYFLSESSTDVPVRVNSEIVQGERELEPGDDLLIDEVSFTFNLQN